MKNICHSNRIKEIEETWNSRIEDLLYQMHYEEDMMHKEIGWQFGRRFLKFWKLAAVMQ